MNFPNLSSTKFLGFDIETWDPHLKELGPSTRRGGYVYAVSLATEDQSWYFPFSEPVMDWLRDTLPGKTLVGANLMYDLEYLLVQHGYFHEAIYDVQIAEPLIDENLFNYSLDALARKYLQDSKSDEELYQWLASHHGGQPTRRDQGGRIALAPHEVVEPYARADAELPLRIMREQKKVIKEQELEEILLLEHRLFPLLLRMREKGVRIDEQRLEVVSNELRTVRDKAIDKCKVDIWSAASIQREYDKRGLVYPRTKQGNPSFTKAVLNESPFGRLIANARRYDQVLNTFVEGHLGKHIINGRLYTQFHQLRSDAGGTISGRFSSSNPNLQNIPARDPELGPLIRSLFVPDGGEMVSLDYSQIEPRLTLHYAPGVESIIDKYRRDPDMDCYATFMENLPEWVDRTATKIVYLALTYGMGKDKTADSLGVSREEAEKIIEAFHAGAPYVGQLKRIATNRAKVRGYIRTLLGRRRRFNLFESTCWKTARRDGAMEEEIARNKYTRVRRAFVYKTLNALIQGSAADVMKKAMVDWYEAYPEWIPHVTVHDELVFSGEGFPADEAQRIMETCVTLRLPLKVDVAKGAHWGECK